MVLWCFLNSCFTWLYLAFLTCSLQFGLVGYAMFVHFQGTGGVCLFLFLLHILLMR